MAITLEQLKKLAEACELNFTERPPGDLVFAFRTDEFVGPSGKKGIVIAASLLEDGRYLRISAPQAFSTKTTHAEAVFKACMMAQWRTKLVQFEYDEHDGEIRPVVEFPIEDGTITAQQLGRCIRGLAGLVDDLYPTLLRAREEGVVEFDPLRGHPLRTQIRELDDMIAKFAALPNPDASLLAQFRALRATLSGEPEPGPPTAV